jgi:SWIM zinc finger
MSRETVQQKAGRYLAEARIRVITCNEDDATLLGDARGNGGSYTVTCEEGVWRCDCPTRRDLCCHIAAFQRVTCFSPREPRQ